MYENQASTLRKQQQDSVTVDRLVPKEGETTNRSQINFTPNAVLLSCAEQCLYNLGVNGINRLFSRVPAGMVIN